MILPAAEETDETPKGTGYGVLKVSTSGNASFVGKLGDGTGFSSRVFVQPDGSVPVFSPLYKTRGSIAGLLSFLNNEAPVSVYGDLSWFKPKIRKDLSYPKGFQLTLAADGSSYVIPAVGTLPLQLSGADDQGANSAFFFSGAGFGSETKTAVFLPVRPSSGSYS
ncbi:MAG: hypothetical protein EOO01_17150, partial [Chitinophagaceae bacterium]